MKITRINIIRAATCGGLLDGLDLQLRSAESPVRNFSPICLVGPNGSGKSQLLQVTAEILQSICHAFAPKEERSEISPDTLFEIEYLFAPAQGQNLIHIRASRTSEGSKQKVTIERWLNSEWVKVPNGEEADYLPHRVVGYTSGDNETLSLPFLASRRNYADEVARQALRKEPLLDESPVPNPRLMFVNYGTHLAILMANLLLGTESQRAFLLKEAHVDELRSFRLSVQRKRRSGSPVKLTPELGGYIEHFKRCATCYKEDHEVLGWTFDFYVDSETRSAFREYWPGGSLSLYESFHKLNMLNDLALTKRTRDRIKSEIDNRRFASRLPEPEHDYCIFRFEQIQFQKSGSAKDVDYVSLSDGEHQLAQLLGIFCMVPEKNTVFLLDEPESHFNPQWRVQFASTILNLPTMSGIRSQGESDCCLQECFLTTHAPFVPSDTERKKVFVFTKPDGLGKIHAANPRIQTYGASFDDILEECFKVSPPISQIARDRVNSLMQSEEASDIEKGIKELGDSVEKVLLRDHLRKVLGRRG